VGEEGGEGKGREMEEEGEVREGEGREGEGSAPKYFGLELPLLPEIIVLYKSLLTENSVATQKHSSASINSNKIQYKIQRPSPSQ